MRHQHHSFLLTAAMSVSIMGFNRQSSAQETPPNSTPSLPRTFVTQAPLTADEFGNLYWPRRSLSRIASPSGTWELAVRELTPNFKKPDSDRLVIIEIENTAAGGKPGVVWRTFGRYSARTYPHPIYRGSLSIDSSGQPLVLIADLQPYRLWVQLFRFDPAKPTLPPQPGFNESGWVVLDRKTLPQAFYTGDINLPMSRQSPTGITIDRASPSDLSVTIHDDDENRPNAPRYLDGPLRERLDFATKKWTVIPPGKTEIAERLKARDHQRTMEVYRYQRERGLTKEEATDFIRKDFKDPAWAPDPQDWDTPDLKAKYLGPRSTPKPDDAPASPVR